MANQTTNIGLRKPVPSENFDIDRDFNANWDIIDGEFGDLEAGVASKADKADTYTKTEVDGKDALKADKTYTDEQLANKADRIKYETQIEAILNEIENIKSNPTQPIQPNIVLKGFSLKNELDYNRETWAEWTNKAQATVENGCLVFDNITVDSNPIIPANFKPTTKYGILVDVPVNTRTASIAISSSSGGTRPFSSTITPTVGVTGNQKFIATTQANVSKNEYALYVMPDNKRIEIKDLRIFELPIGSQIEQDFDRMSADQLAIKYPYIKGDRARSTISAMRLTSLENGQIAKAYIPYVGELKSDSTSYDEIIIQNGKAELFRRVGLETPTITNIAITGNILAGETYLEPIDLVKGIYNNGISVTHTDLPILTIDSITKSDGTVLDVSKAVITSNKLSFTHPNLTNGDTVSFEYFYDKEGTKGVLEVTMPDNPTPPPTALRTVKKKLYSFGVLSDVHIKETTLGGTDSNNSQGGYVKALSYYQANGAEFVCITGDLVASWMPNGSDVTQGERIWAEELRIFKGLTDNNFNKDVYFCAGNHDASTSGQSGGTLRNLVKSYGDGTKTGKQIYTEILGRPLNYNFEYQGDVFIFFSMDNYNYTNFCLQEDMDWLVDKLDANKSKRVFLFFHIPMPDTFVPNSPFIIGWSNTMADQLNKLFLNGSYDNVTWFSGHSHYDLRLEEAYPNVNVYTRQGLPTMVHCPSSSYLRTPTEDGHYINHPEGSQGYMVDVYSDKIVVNGIDFTLGTNGASIPIAHYII